MNKKVSTLVAALMAAGALVLPKDVFAQIKYSETAKNYASVEPATVAAGSYYLVFTEGGIDYVAIVNSSHKLEAVTFDRATLGALNQIKLTTSGSGFDVKTSANTLGFVSNGTAWGENVKELTITQTGEDAEATLSIKGSKGSVTRTGINFAPASKGVITGTFKAKLVPTTSLVKQNDAVSPVLSGNIDSKKTYVFYWGEKALTGEEDGTAVMSAYDTRNSNQLWYVELIDPKGTEVRLKNAETGKYLIVDDAAATQVKLTVTNTNGDYRFANYSAIALPGVCDDVTVKMANSVTTTIYASDLNSVNRGSFSLNYQFDKDHKATVNPFNKEIKAFEYKNNLYLATSWPSELNNVDYIPSIDLFEKCVFIVANPSDDWNISEFNEFGESSKFIEVKGNRLISGVSAGTAKLSELKAGKVAVENAQYYVEKYADSSDYLFAMAKVYGLSDDNTTIKESSSWLSIALVDDQQGRIVTTVPYGIAERAGEIELGATITNNRTVTAKDFLSTDKASVFNIKFVSKPGDEETASEYNKYLTLSDDALMIAHGSDFTNLNAPESQWIVESVVDNVYTFINRENPSADFSVELVSTDKEGVYEIRDVVADESTDGFTYFYVDKSGKYTPGSYTSFTGKVAQFIAVTPDAEAGYASTELDNAGLVRLMFESRENNLLASELFVTAEQKDLDKNGVFDVAVSKEETDAAQFSVVKFDAASTATALSDTIYAVNDYAVLKEAGKDDTKTIFDGDSIAVVSYAFKQLRADGENYYLSANMQSVEKQDDESKAPRFLVKINKNGSYSLISVGTNDELRDVLSDVNEKTFDLDGTSSANIDANGTSVYYDYSANHKYDFNILKETPGTSFNHVPQHVTMEAVNGGYVAMNAESKEGIVAPVSTLKAEYTKEDLTFWLDTTDSEAVTPSFMISKAGNYMYNAVDSLNAYNDGTASAERVEDFALNVNGDNLPKVIFQSADLTKVEDIENYKFQIVQSPESEDEYIIKSLNGYTYVAAHNQKLYISTQADAALRLTVTPAEAPTSNESVSASEVAVVAQNGSVVVKNAAGKNVVVSTILGQVVANEVLTSDNATINVPAGIVVVAVEGESFKVNVK